MEYLNFNACNIEDCTPFRIGITVNFFFFALAVAVTLMMHVALKPQEKIREAIRDEVRLQLAHIGYSLLLVSGCAFFGVFPVSKLEIGNYIIFGEAWAILLLVLLIFDLAGNKYTGNTDMFSISRKLAIPTSACFIYWVWVGPYLDLGRL